MSTAPQKEYVQKALTEYAAFFRELTRGQHALALRSLKNIEAVDGEAMKELDEEQLGYYRARRTRLMQLFRKKLVGKLRGQVEQEILEQVEELVETLEKNESLGKLH